MRALNLVRIVISGLSDKAFLPQLTGSLLN